LRLNRPDKLNALDAEMVAVLARRCVQIEHEATARVVNLSGEVEVFSSSNWWQREPRDVLDLVAERFRSVC